jgi:hypothetical protein
MKRIYIPEAQFRCRLASFGHPNSGMATQFTKFPTGRATNPSCRAFSSGGMHQREALFMIHFLGEAQQLLKHVFMAVK